MNILGLKNLQGFFTLELSHKKFYTEHQIAYFLVFGPPIRSLPSVNHSREKLTNTFSL